jgi:hypothetical protein
MGLSFQSYNKVTPKKLPLFSSHIRLPSTLDSTVNSSLAAVRIHIFGITNILHSEVKVSISNHRISVEELRGFEVTRCRKSCLMQNLISQYIVEPGYNNIRLCETPFITSDIQLYRIISRC